MRAAVARRRSPYPLLGVSAAQEALQKKDGETMEKAADGARAKIAKAARMRRRFLKDIMQLPY
jgi:hypothetical protein